jgi:hypothetical protein
MKSRHRLTDTEIQSIRTMIEVDGLQQRIVAERVGVHQGTIEKLVKRLGLKTQRTGPRSGEGHTNWGGGIVVRKGYRYVYSPTHPNAVFGKKYVAEHRLVMESKIGRLLLRSEVVHHIDGDTANNSPENLMVFGENKSHLKHELTGRVPNWTPEGHAKILAVAEGKRKYEGTPTERRREAGRQYDMRHRRKELGGGQPPQPGAHQPS